MTSDFVLRLRPEPHVQDGVGDLSGLLRRGFARTGSALSPLKKLPWKSPGLACGRLPTTSSRRHREDGYSGGCSAADL